MADQQHAWSASFQALRIPSDYARYNNLYDDKLTLDKLCVWRNNIQNSLHALQNQVAHMRNTGQIIPDAVLANIIFYVVPYTILSEGDDLELAPWNTPDTYQIAIDILSVPQISQPSVSLIRRVLLENIKPIFSLNPHPYVNTTSGRKLLRPAGGPDASLDYYNEQAWKSYPGLWSVISWVVRNLPTSAYEELWHLLIPPTMTLLDDFEATHKLEGIKIVNSILQNIPTYILQRTGIDGLLFTSFKTALAHLTEPEAPTLLRLTISTSLNLTLKVTQPNSEERFNQLCNLLGGGIIEGIWMYSSGNIPAMKATVDSLPPLATALGIGTTRYLKSLVTQLCHILATMTGQLSSPEVNREIIELQKSAGRSLLIIMEVCAVRMEGWKFTILDAVAKCWVGLIGTDHNNMDPELQNILREIMSSLVEVCPNISQNAYKALLMEDQTMFNGLIGVPPSPSTPTPVIN